MSEMDEWLSEYRSKDHSNDNVIDLDLDDDDIARINRAATVLGMSFDEYCNYALFEALKEYRCPTCMQFRPDRSQTCEHCGEID